MRGALLLQLAALAAAINVDRQQGVHPSAVLQPEPDFGRFDRL